MSDSKTKSGGFLFGAAFLMFSTVIVKLISALFKIPLTNLIGGDGMGYFSTAYTLFNPIAVISVAGLPVAVSKLISEKIAKSRMHEAELIRQTSVRMFLVLGIFGGIFMALLAKPFTSLIGNPFAAKAVLALAPSVFFLCLMSAYRGYFEGRSNMMPTGISQIIESSSKLIFGLGGAFFIIKLGLAQSGSGVIFGMPAGDPGTERALIYSFAAAGAILGVTVGTMTGSLFLLLRYAFGKDKISTGKRSFTTEERRTVIRQLASIALPVCVGALITNLTSLIDVSSVMNRLAHIMETSGDALLSAHSGNIPPDISLQGVPNYLYGAYQSAVNLFLLIPALVTGLGVSALPRVSAAFSEGNSKSVARYVEVVLKYTLLISIPAGLGLFALSEPILRFLYPQRPMEVAIAAPLLSVLGIAVIFVAVTVPANSMLQAVSRERLPVIFMLIGGAVKLITNYTLVSIPWINIRGAVFGSLLCYMFISIASVTALMRVIKLKISITRAIIMPLVCGFLCAVAAKTSFSFLQKTINTRYDILFSIAIAAIFYALLLFLSGIIGTEDVYFLENHKNN